MARREAYLVRGADGRMRTVQAFSVRGAAKLYLAKYRPKRGDIIEIKPRGRGDWEAFKIT